MTRSSSTTYHSCLYASLLRTVATIRAPWLGGFDHVVLTINSICERTFVIASEFAHTITKFPTLSSENNRINHIQNVSKPAGLQIIACQLSSVTNCPMLMNRIRKQVQWWFVYPDTFVPGRYFQINKFSGLLNHPFIWTLWNFQKNARSCGQLIAGRRSPSRPCWRCRLGRISRRCVN